MAILKYYKSIIVYADEVLWKYIFKTDVNDSAF